MTVYFSSDQHFGHANVIKYANRPFKDVNEMDDAMIDNWNKVVKSGDNIYLIGDLFFYRDEDKIECILKALNGNKFLIFGNHDKLLRNSPRLLNHFEWHYDLHKIRVREPLNEGGWQHIILCHYAMRVWDQSHYGSWQLYGHSHGTLPDDPNARSCDVGVDSWNYTPVSYETLRDQVMANKTWKPVDHHDPERRKAAYAEYNLKVMGQDK